MSEANNIFVQILPIIKNVSNEDGKILLCKWNQGDFKGRFTGLIRNIDSKALDFTNDINLRSELKRVAISLLPCKVSQEFSDIDLVAILKFTDSPAYDEYVYLVNLKDNTDEMTAISFDGNQCYWFQWGNIPFNEMPADDPLWYPKVLQEGLKVTGSFTFGSWSEKTLKSYSINNVSHL